MNILVLNAGSSSLKFEIITDRWVRVTRGAVERIGGHATLRVQAADSETKQIDAVVPDARAAVDLVLREAIPSGQSIQAAGHRVVHGGERFRNSVLITPEVLNGIRECVELAPLHNPANIRGIEAVQTVLGPTLPQVAVFDTSFHQQLPERAYLYPLPFDLYQRFKVRRYGFHGTSYRYLWSRYAALTGPASERAKVIALHLGNGCSICAIEGGRPIDTSMGFTPLEGLMMGARSGDVDPSLVAFLSGKTGQSADQIESVLNNESGLLGVSGLTNDMRDLLKEANHNGNQRAQLAIEMFCYRACKYVGAYLAALGGADAIIFSAGIGEHTPEIRARICQNLRWCGLMIDDSRNAAAIGREAIITTADSAVIAWVIPTDEELMIAQDTYRLTHT
ncbi:MAG TPA: acetate kinase [Bryobacteraceae bacterium]|jgi:acetate kinase|nr:acetate kinase [Bryobacteraceae bacterium]